MTLAFIIAVSVLIGGIVTVNVATSPDAAHLGFITTVIGLAMLVVTSLVWLFA